jgi:cell division topological specificity factor
MSLFDLFRSKQKNTAATAKERLRIIVAQERAQRGSPDYLPMLQREILEVIRRYVQVEQDAVNIRVENEGDNGLLELNVMLPTQTDGDTRQP